MIPTSSTFRLLLIGSFIAVSSLVAQEAAAPATETVEVKVGSRKVGDSMTQSVAMEMNLQMSIDAGGESAEITQKMTMSIKHKSTILEMADGQTSKLKIEFKEAKTKMEMEGIPGMPELPETPNPLDGKTIIVAKKDGAFTLNYEDGSEVESEISEVVQKQYLTQSSQFSLIDPLITHLAKSPVTLGRTMSIPTNVLDNAFSELFKFEKFDLTPKEKSKHFGRPCVVCDVVMEGKGDVADGMSMGMKLKGTQRIALDPGHTAELSVEGPISMDGAPDTGELEIEMSMSASGSLKLSQITFFESAKTE